MATTFTPGVVAPGTSASRIAATMLFESKADRSCLRCRLCHGRRIPLGAVARHAATHIAAGEAEPSGAHRAFGHAARWHLTSQGMETLLAQAGIPQAVTS